MNGIPYVHKLPHTRGVTQEVRGYNYACMLCADCRDDVDMDHLRISKLSKIQNGGKQPIEQDFSRKVAAETEKLSDLQTKTVTLWAPLRKGTLGFIGFISYDAMPSPHEICVDLPPRPRGFCYRAETSVEFLAYGLCGSEVPSNSKHGYDVTPPKPSGCKQSPSHSMLYFPTFTPLGLPVGNIYESFEMIFPTRKTLPNRPLPTRDTLQLQN